MASNSLIFYFLARDKASRTFNRLSNKAGALGGALRKLGLAAKVAGLVAFGGLALISKAAIDWESAWAGVRKTVDASNKELAKLEGQIRELARTLPLSHKEIAKVAELAGQLGVRTQDIRKFTKVMVDLGVTTNLSASEAAKSFARFTNITGTADKDVDKLASTLVHLGNNSATTEAEIMEMALRLAAAGRIAGLSESDILAFASTMSSVGVRAAAGGTAVQKAFLRMRNSVLEGGKELEVFASVAGMTASEFAKAFKEDPALAMAAFITGLGRMNDKGESTRKVFEDVGLADQRLMRALLSTSEAGDLLVDQLKIADEAWKENTALTEEANKRYDTAESKIKIAGNALRDLAISIGETVLPVIGELADAFSDWVNNVNPGEKLKPLGDKMAKAIRNDVIPAVRGAWGNLSAVLFGEKEVQGQQGGSGRAVVQNMGGGLVDQAKKMAQSIIDGITEGFRTGDFGPLGEAIGEAIGNALNRFGKLANKFFEWVGAVDWMEVGIKAGKLLVPFALGLLVGFVNGLDPTILVPMMAEHWQEILLAAVTVAFAPAKFIKWVANALRKIPFVGTFFGWLLESFASLSRKVIRPVFKFIGNLAKSFVDGLTGGGASRVVGAVIRWGGRIVDSFTRTIGALPTAVGVLIINIGEAFVRGAGVVGGHVGRFIRFITTPFRTAIGFFVQIGGQIIGGLVKGLRSAFGFVTGVVKQVVGFITRPFAAAGSWLLRQGRTIIDGLIRGLKGAFNLITSAIGQAIRFVTAPFRAAGGWLTQEGGQIIRGLLRGIGSVAKTIGGFLVNNVSRPVLNVFRTAGSWLLERGVQLIRGLLRGVTSVAKSIGSWMFNNVIRPALNAFNNARNWLVDRGVQLVRGLLRGVISVAKSIGRWMLNNVIRPALAAFNNARNWLVQRGVEFVKGLLAGIWSVAKSIGRWLRRNVVNPALRVFSNIKDWLFGPGRNFIFGLRDGILDVIATIARWLRRNVKRPVVNFFDNAKDWLIEAGKDLLRGLKEGAMNLLSKPVKFFKKIGNAIVKGVKDFFGMDSPSKMFMGFGADMMKGMILGMLTENKNIPDVIDKMFGGWAGIAKFLFEKGVLNILDLPGNLTSGAIEILKDIGIGLFDFAFGDDGKKVAKLVGSPDGAFRFPLPFGSYRIGQGLGAGRGHTGQDLPAPIGTPVYAPFSGVISRRVVRGSYGRHLRIAAGAWQFLAAHLSAFARTGSFVKKGQLVGFVGSTGNSTGPHLHMEFRRGGALLSPLSLFAKGGRAKAGQTALVGEEGPELVKFGSSSRIFSNKDTQDMLSIPTQSTPIINVRVFLGNEELTDRVQVQIDSTLDNHDRKLKRRTRSGTGLAR